MKSKGLHLRVERRFAAGLYFWMNDMALHSRLNMQYNIFEGTTLLQISWT